MIRTIMIRRRSIGHRIVMMFRADHFRLRPLRQLIRFPGSRRWSLLDEAGDELLQLRQLGLQVLAVTRHDLELSLVLLQPLPLLLPLVLVDRDVLAHRVRLLLKLNYHVLL